MSFNINGPSNKPIIQEAQNMMNNGGGGNLGYFMRENPEETINFVSSEEEDTFKKSVDIDEDNDNSFIIDKIINFLKRIYKAIVLMFTSKKTVTKDDEFVKNN